MLSLASDFVGQAGKKRGRGDRVPDVRELHLLQGADVPQEDLARKIKTKS
jgi:hypothetical protein